MDVKLMTGRGREVVKMKASIVMMTIDGTDFRVCVMGTAWGVDLFVLL